MGALYNFNFTVLFLIFTSNFVVVLISARLVETQKRRPSILSVSTYLAEINWSEKSGWGQLYDNSFFLYVNTKTIAATKIGAGGGGGSAPRHPRTLMLRACSTCTCMKLLQQYHSFVGSQIPRKL